MAQKTINDVDHYRIIMEADSTGVLAILVSILDDSGGVHNFPFNPANLTAAQRTTLNQVANAFRSRARQDGGWT